MSSVRKIRSNRFNSRKSTGPRSAAGKVIASRNAVRHGLSTLEPETVPAATIAPFVKNICGKDADPRLVAAATAVAQHSAILRIIVEQQNALIERLREPIATALVKRDNSLELGTARFMQAWLASHEIETLVPKALEKYKDQMLPPLQCKEGTPDWFKDMDDLVPIRLKALLEETSDEDYAQAEVLARKNITAQERDDHEALSEALPDMVRLERYYRRAWFRYKRAALHLISVSSMIRRG